MILGVEGGAVRVADVGGIHIHGAELVAGEGLAILSHAGLAEEDWSLGIDFDKQGYEKQEGRRESETQQGEGDVYQAFDNPLMRLHPFAARFKISSI